MENNEVKKTKLLSLKSADAAADIELINKYSLKKLAPEDVFVFSVILCDNEIDRDFEQFTPESLKALAGLFLGKVGISDHNWRAEKQIARIYRTKTEKTGEKNSLGEDKIILRGDAYMLREHNEKIISAIEGGIMKEVSVGCSVEKEACSICDEKIGFWTGTCKNGHHKGEKYDDKLCYGKLENATEAYEFSFVAVPAQPGAGVIKMAKKDLEQLFENFMAADIGELEEEQLKALVRKGQEALLPAEERRKRALIMEKYRDKGEENDTV